MGDRLEVVLAVDEQVRRLAGAIRLAGRAECRIGDVVVADVVRQVLADEQVVGVVDDLVRVAIRECAGIQELQFTDGQAGGPGRVAERVLDLVGAEAFDRVLADAGIGEEHAVRLEILLGVLQVEAQVVGDVPAEADAATVIGRLVEVLLDQRAVVGLQEGDA